LYRRVLNLLSGRMWWAVFAVMIAGPAVTLGLLGLRAIRADRIEQVRQAAENRTQTAVVVDATLRSGMEELRRELLAPRPIADATHFEIRGNMVVFPEDRTYFADFGNKPAEVRRPASEIRDIADEAQAAESADSPAAALASYARLAGTELRDWAAWQTARLRFEQGDARQIGRITSAEWANTSATTPGGCRLRC
jgi:hypothetical protein